MVAFAFAIAPVLVASPAPDGGPDPASFFGTNPHHRDTANSEPRSPAPDGGPTYVFATPPPHRDPANSEAIPESPVVTIHSTDNVTRGKTGTFVLNMSGTRLLGGMYVNFSLSGSAVAGVDYVQPLSPAYIGQSGYGVIQIQTLPDPRGLANRQAYDVVVNLEPGVGYALGLPSSARILIKP